MSSKAETTITMLASLSPPSPGVKNDLDPLAQMFARMVLLIRRAACKREDATERFKHILGTYTAKHNRNGEWPKWYRSEAHEDEDPDEAYPDEQPHPSTNEHDENLDEDICSVGPIGLLVESVLWHGLKIDAELRVWQKE